MRAVETHQWYNDTGNALNEAPWLHHNRNNTGFSTGSLVQDTLYQFRYLTGCEEKKKKPLGFIAVTHIQRSASHATFLTNRKREERKGKKESTWC